MFNRRGFIARTLGLVGTIPSLLAGSTPALNTLAKIDMVPVPIPKPRDQDAFIEFLLKHFYRREALYLSGDIGGFTSDVSVTHQREKIDVTQHNAPHGLRRYIDSVMPVTRVKLGLQLAHSCGNVHRFDLEIEDMRGYRCEPRLVSPDSLPPRSPIIPIFNNQNSPLGAGHPWQEMKSPSCLILLEPQFFIRGWEDSDHHRWMDSQPPILL